jgi:hypothetical protein
MYRAIRDTVPTHFICGEREVRYGVYQRKDENIALLLTTAEYFLNSDQQIFATLSLRLAADENGPDRSVFVTRFDLPFAESYMAANAAGRLRLGTEAASPLLPAYSNADVDESARRYSESAALQSYAEEFNRIAPWSMPPVPGTPTIDYDILVGKKKTKDSEEDMFRACYAEDMRLLFGYKPWTKDDDTYFNTRCVCRAYDATEIAYPCEHLCLCPGCFADCKKKGYLERCPRCFEQVTRFCTLGDE